MAALTEGQVLLLISLTVVSAMLVTMPVPIPEFLLLDLDIPET